MLEPLLSSVGGSKLISALLLERTFLLNIVKAMLQPGTPTLAMLTGGRVKSQQRNASSNDQPSEESILLQYKYLFNRRETVQLNFNFKQNSDSDDAKADIGSDGSVEDLDRSFTAAQKPGFNGMANVRLSKHKKEKESNRNQNKVQPPPKKPPVVVNRKVEIPKTEVDADPGSPVAKAYTRMSKPKTPTQDNNLTQKSNNTSMVKGNYPTSTSTAVEASHRPETKMSQPSTVSQDLNKGAKQNGNDFVTDQPLTGRPRQPAVFTQDYMISPYVRSEKKVDKEVKPAPQLVAAFSFSEIETKQQKVQETKDSRHVDLKAVVAEAAPERVEHEEHTGTLSFTEVKPLTQPNQHHNYTELPKHQSNAMSSGKGKVVVDNLVEQKMAGRGVEFDFNFQNTDTYNVTEEQIVIGDEDDFFEGKLTNVTQVRESEVAQQIELITKLKEDSHGGKRSAEDTRLNRTLEVKQQTVGEPPVEVERRPPVIFQQDYIKPVVNQQANAKEEHFNLIEVKEPQKVRFHLDDIDYFGDQGKLKQKEEAPDDSALQQNQSFGEEQEQPNTSQRNLYDEEFKRIQEAQRLQSEPKKVEVLPETKSQQSQEVPVVPEQEWGQFDFQPSSSGSSEEQEQEEEDLVSEASIDEHEVVEAGVIEAEATSEKQDYTNEKDTNEIVNEKEEFVSQKEELPRPSTAKERRNIFNAGSDSEYGTNRNQDDLNFVNNAEDEEDLFNDLHQFEP